VTDFSDAEFEDLIRRFAPAFVGGLVAGSAGLPGSAPVIKTKEWGPIEGTRTGNSITWTFPDSSWLEVRLLSDGGMEIYRNDRFAGRLGSVERVPEYPPDAE